MHDLDDLLKKAIQEAATERGHINVLIAGRSGVGKSTLINAIFQQNLAETGQGRPVTQHTREISKDGVPLTILDTRGLEMSDFKTTLAELEKTVRERCADRDSNRHIHVVWLCVQEDGRRVESAEIDLHNMLSNHVPVLTVITKARSDDGFKQEVIKLLPNSRNVVRVRAIAERFDDDHVLNPMNLETLVAATSEVIPEGKRRALAAAQKASIGYKREQAHKIVASAATAAAAAGATPIPFADAVILAPIQVGMIAGITSVFALVVNGHPVYPRCLGNRCFRSDLCGQDDRCESHQAHSRSGNCCWRCHIGSHGVHADHRTWRVIHSGTRRSDGCECGRYSYGEESRSETSRKANRWAAS